MLPRPKILLDYGRENQPIRVPNADLVNNEEATFLTNDTEADVATVTVANTVTPYTNSGSSIYAVIGQVGGATTEGLIQISSLSDTVVSLAANTVYAHSASTPLYYAQYNQVEISHADTVEGSKTVLDTLDIYPTQQYTSYLDTTNTDGYYFARWYNSEDDTYSPYSDPAPYNSYTLLSARSIIDDALAEINKTTSNVLSDEFAFQQLDMFQTDVLRELKRWSFMQKFDAIIGQFDVGEWRIPLPVAGNDLDLPAIADSETNKSIYNIRVGTNGRLTWIDKAKWDDFVFNLAYSQLADNLEEGDTVMALNDSSDFNHLTADNTDGSGTVIIGGNSYDYTDNDIETGILTLSEAITADNTATQGAWVFQNANQGLPEYYTIFDDYVWYWPITSSQYDGLNAFMDYYIAQTRIRKDSDEIVVPDAQCASYFLQWKFLKKLNNGQEDQTTLVQKQNYIERREKLKNKEVLNRTFKLKPRFQNFAIQEQWDSGDPRYIRDGAFPNTGF